MTRQFSREYFQELEEGKIAGRSWVHKFGTNTSVGTSYEAVVQGGFYQTPTATTSLEIVSSSTNDTNTAGSGARKVYIQGLDANFDLQDETVNMNGTTAVALANTYIRIFRLYVSESGTYATQSNASHDGTITLRVASAGATWAQIVQLDTGFGAGQSQIGAYTVPNGYTAYVYLKHISVDAAKTANVAFFKRDNADDVATPYSGTMRIVSELDGLQGFYPFPTPIVIGTFPAKTDIGFLAKAAAAGTSVSVDFDIILKAN